MRDTRRGYSIRGFTLVEILVVILIIGLGIGIVTFTIGGNRPLVLRNEAGQLANQLEIVASEASLGGDVWGLQFYRETDRDSGDSFVAWRWLHFREPDASPAPDDKDSKNDKDKKQNRLGWQPEAPREMDGGGRFGGNVDAVLEIEGNEVPIELLAPDDKPSKKAKEKDDNSKDQLKPDIWVTPGGEMTPFALHLNFSGEQYGPIVRADAIGRVEVETQHEER